jgi:hypothetical protein
MRLVLDVFLDPSPLRFISSCLHRSTFSFQRAYELKQLSLRRRLFVGFVLRRRRAKRSEPGLGQQVVFV